CEQSDYADVHRARDQKRICDSESFWHGKQSGMLIKIHILASVENIESAHPERDGSAQNQHAQIEIAGDGDPRSCGRNAQRESQKKMRPAGETLGVRIEKQNRQRDGRQLQRQRIQLPRGEDERPDCGERENPGEALRESSSCERSLCSAWIFLVVAYVCDAVDGHCGASRSNHCNYNPKELFPGWPTVPRKPSCQQRTC